MRIYADFNAQIDPGGAGRLGLVHLDRLGTLRDLCAARLLLQDGLHLTLYTDSDENEDLEIEAIARWISNPNAINGGYWAGEFDPKKFRDVPIQRTQSSSTWFPCSACGTNLAEEITRFGLNSSTRCTKCGVNVHRPIAPPEARVLGPK
jgi:hypothetical protein